MNVWHVRWSYIRVTSGHCYMVYWIVSLCLVKSSQKLDVSMVVSPFEPQDWTSNLTEPYRSQSVVRSVDGSLKSWYCKYHECTTCFTVCGQRGSLNLNLCNWLRHVVTHVHSILYCNKKGRCFERGNNYNLMYYVIIQNLSFASLHKKKTTLFPSAWFFTSVCAFWGHFSRWCDCRFTQFLMVHPVYVWHIFLTCKCCNYLVIICIHVPLTTHSFSDWYYENYFIQFYQETTCYCSY